MTDALLSNPRHFIRFWDRVLIGDGCWEWQGYVSPGPRGGYGRYAAKAVHRITYECFVGTIPVGLEIDHLCRNRRCVRPDHLEAVTHRINCLRGLGVSGRGTAAGWRTLRLESYVRPTACPAGHLYTEDSVRLGRNGSRRCLECERESSRQSYLRGRGAGRTTLRHSRVMTPELLGRIETLLAEGLSTYAVAARVGLCQTTIQNVKRRTREYQHAC